MAAIFILYRKSLLKRFFVKISCSAFEAAIPAQPIIFLILIKRLFGGLMCSLYFVFHINNARAMYLLLVLKCYFKIIFLMFALFRITLFRTLCF